jgi:hypothetical protein
MKTEVDALAGKLHEDWQKAHRNLRGNEPHLKPTEDRIWTAAHNGRVAVDLSNTAFSDLPTDWQRENREAAKVALELVLECEADKQPLNDAFVDRAAAVAHLRWLERVGSDAPPNLRVPFARLPSEEQEKDRHQIRMAIKVHRKQRSWWRALLPK